ncbi:MAG: hypothetical protein EXS42_03800 [Lacunisphaera sp.]|nr:hypothetical protein [Lacunisphaera sp.]
MSSPSPEPPVTGEIATLLNQAVQRLSPEVLTAKLHTDRLVVKYPAGRRYLVLTPKQGEMLQEFGAGRTVTAVLCAAISAQRCPPLREFYELVVKAVRAGILQTDTQPLPQTILPAKWSLRLSGSLLGGTSAMLALGAGVSLSLHPLRMPDNPAELLVGWAVACVAVSAGWMLAASVLKAAGVEVYQPRLKWKTIAPRFTVDVEDALMGGRSVQANAA